MQKVYLKEKKNVKIRKIEKSDIPELLRIHKEFFDYFPFPNLDDPICAFQWVVVDDTSKIVLASVIRLTAEAIFLTDKNLSNIKRAKAIKLINDEKFDEVMNFGLEDLIAFAEKANKYPNILTKLGWVKRPGVAMARGK